MVNYHIALRTFNHPSVAIETVAKSFLALGDEEMVAYDFPEKNLKAKHYKHSTENEAPLVFISELVQEACSVEVQAIINSAIQQIPQEVLQGSLAFSGRSWGKPSYSYYETLRKESEYAAWTYLYGIRVNHFTVLINALQDFSTIQEVNKFLRDNDYPINTSGGEVKGTPEMLLEQSST